MKSAVKVAIEACNERDVRAFIHDVLVSMADALDGEPELTRVLRIIARDIKEEKV